MARKAYISAENKALAEQAAKDAVVGLEGTVPVGIDLKIDAAKVEQYLANAVIHAGLGTKVGPVIQGEVERLLESWDRRSWLGDLVEGYLRDLVIEVLENEVKDKLRPKIVAMLMAQDTVDKAVKASVERIARGY